MFKNAALVVVWLEGFTERGLLGLAFEDKLFAADFRENVVVIASRAVCFRFDRGDGEFDAMRVKFAQIERLPSTLPGGESHLDTAIGGKFHSGDLGFKPASALRNNSCNGTIG